MNDKTETIDENKVLEDEITPDENSGFIFSSFLKITDPNTQEVLVQKRGDN